MHQRKSNMPEPNVVYAVMPEGEKNLRGPVIIGGDNLPSPDWNRIPASLI